MPVLAYPAAAFIAGRPGQRGLSSESADPVLDMVIALHTAPAGARRHAMTEDFRCPALGRA
jgi:hypothetical protein